MSEVITFFRDINKTTIKHLDNLGVGLYEIVDENAESVKFLDITAYISVSGIIKGGFIFSVETKLAHALVPKVVMCELTEQEIPDYANEVIAEIANMISANALIGREVEDIFLGTPLMILGTNARLTNMTKEGLAKRFVTPEGQFLCLYVPSAKGEEIAIKVD